MRKILFVCTGNTCRSAMAQAIFNDMAKRDFQLRDSFFAISAGVAACEGDPASTNAVRVLLEEWEIDISEHNSRLISYDLIADSYLILTMCQRHKSILLHKYPQFKNKIFTLKEVTSNNIINRNDLGYNYDLDISDPYGMSFIEYKRCAVEIKEAIEKLILVLKTSGDC